MATDYPAVNVIMSSQCPKSESNSTIAGDITWIKSHSNYVDIGESTATSALSYITWNAG